VFVRPVGPATKAGGGSSGRGAAGNKLGGKGGGKGGVGGWGKGGWGNGNGNGKGGKGGGGAQEGAQLPEEEEVLAAEVPGLRYGVQYTFTVGARNSNGAGPESAGSAPLRTRKPLDKPEVVVGAALLTAAACAVHCCFPQAKKQLYSAFANIEGVSGYESVPNFEGDMQLKALNKV
jgi:hypothetical protein